MVIYSQQVRENLTRKGRIKMTATEIKKAREFYGIYGYVCDETVLRLCEIIKINGLQYAKENTGILKRLSYKNW